MIPMTFPQPKGDPKVLDIDEQFRAGTTVEGLAKLKTDLQYQDDHRR